MLCHKYVTLFFSNIAAGDAIRSENSESHTTDVSNDHNTARDRIPSRSWSCIDVEIRGVLHENTVYLLLLSEIGEKSCCCAL